MELKFNQSDTIPEIIDKIEAFKSQYEEILASFSYWDLKKKNEYKWKVKKDIYSLKMADWKKGIIWEYINGLEKASVLYKIK